MRRWRAANSERNKATVAARRAKNLEQVRAKEREWSAKNRDKKRAACKKWYNKNVQQERNRCREKRALNLARYQKYSRVYNAENRPRVAVIARNRRARELNNGGRHTAVDIEFLFEAQHGKCAYCRIGLRQGYHVDHIMPLARNGGNGRQNLQLLCAPCNQSKSARDPIEYAQSKGMLI
jgi:5-methylcytosine-specific restriction endonuclease McrA